MESCEFMCKMCKTLKESAEVIGEVKFFVYENLVKYTVFNYVCAKTLGKVVKSGSKTS